MGYEMQSGMAEAVRLTREGRLAEATDVIQRALRGESSSASSDEGDVPMETTSRVNEAPGPTAPPQPGPTDRALRRAPKPPRRFRGAPSRGGVVPGIVPGTVEGAPTIVPAGGSFVERSYTNRAGTRTYKLYIPSGYVGQEVPLVVMLHGCTQNPDDLAAGTRMNVLAEEHTFLVAYPAQAAGANSSGCRNWFKSADQRRGGGEPSIIAGITCEVIGEYHVVIGRVYVAGMSGGGAMAAILGETYPDIYAAVGVHSGLAPGAASDLPSAFTAMRQGGTPAGKSAQSVPAILFHGDRDATMHPRNAEHLLAHHLAGDKALQMTTRRGQVPGGYAYTCATHRDAGGRVVVERWTVHGLGHAWSGGSGMDSYTDPKGPDASAEMVRFFNQHARPERLRLALRMPERSVGC
ncbi:MAG: PHB depolymerase family esterase [Rubrobacteraceae bacterium]|nr:PHB depolymerase family esterase [Rubrobacteraceae bacterium]